MGIHHLLRFCLAAIGVLLMAMGLRNPALVTVSAQLAEWLTLSPLCPLLVTLAIIGRGPREEIDRRALARLAVQTDRSVLLAYLAQEVR